MQSRDDQGRNEEGGATDCTGKGVGNALTCCAGGVGGIEGDGFKGGVRGAVDTGGACGIEGGGIEAVENAVFGVQSMEVDVEGMEIENGNAVAS